MWCVEVLGSMGVAMYGVVWEMADRLEKKEEYAF